jgi:HAD superfamily hydrolase (TIGR01484 family)
MSRLLLCTDLDRTLLPNGAQPESPAARRRFGEFVAQQPVTLAYVTGRHRALVERAVSSYGIPVPDFVISDVGTRIHDLRGGDWQTWAAWEQAIDRDWGGLDHRALQGLLSDLTALRLQERSKQSAHKLSYYVPLQTDRRVLCEGVEQRLQAAGVRANLVWSVDEPNGVGLLDVLPASAGKLEAIRFLHTELGFREDETIFAGDSGNDLPVLASSLPAVLVANAADEVRAEAQAAAAVQGAADRLYLARGGVLGMNGNYSAGILEGIAHFHPELFARLRAQGGWLDAG